MLKEGYRRVYNKDLVKVVQGELSMKTERYASIPNNGILRNAYLVGCSTWLSAGRGMRIHMSTSSRFSRTSKRCIAQVKARLAR